MPPPPAEQPGREPVIDPDLPIIDCHHHLWDHPVPTGDHAFERVLRRNPRYLVDDFIADIDTGHDVRATVIIETGAMYRTDGPIELRPVGETEFAASVADSNASRLGGRAQLCAGIVGYADLRIGDRVTAVLEAHIEAGRGRFRGIRNIGAFDPDATVLGPLAHAPEGLYRDPLFREGFSRLEQLGLSFDAWVLEPQLPDVIDLARSFPGTSIILDHAGSPLGVSAYDGRRPARYATWRDNIVTLAACGNVMVKLGGLAMPLSGFPSFLASPPAGAAQLASEWRPYLQPCIEAFGANRCMFESNYPVDAGSGGYSTLWNAFKIAAAHASADEKRALFHDTAKRAYRL